MHFERYNSGKTGMPPGTPVYIGNAPPHETVISILTYNDKEVSGFESLTAEGIPLCISDEYKAWIKINGLSDTVLIETLLTSLHVHPLVIEDILNTKGRSKVEEFDDFLFIVLNRFFINSADGIKDEQISLIITEKVVITCIESDEPFYQIQERIQHTRGRFRQNGVDYLAYTIIDTVVDGYFLVLETLEERIEELEDEIISTPSSEIINAVQFFRHDLVWFRRRIWSLRECISKLERTDSSFIHNTTHLFFRDVYDHTIKIAEDVDVYREMADGLMEIYLSKISNNTNEIMKMLTIIANIFIPLTFIAGIYGMNFEYMPELSQRYGYPSVLIVMALVALLLLTYFRKKEWI